MSILIKSDKEKFPRRGIIKGLGVTALAPLLPVLEADAQNGALPKRVCFITCPNGIAPEVVPSGGQTNFNWGSSAQALNAVKNDVSFLHGIDLKTWTNNKIPNDHPPVIHQIWTCNESIDPMDGSRPAVSSTWLGRSISIDHYLGNRLAERNDTKTVWKQINAGADTGRFAWQQVYSAARKPVFPETNAKNLHGRIFDGVNGSSGGSNANPETLRRLEQQQSVIDLVQEELQAIRSKIGQADREKIEAHLDAVRGVEERIAFLAESNQGGGGQCSKPNVRDVNGNDDQRHRGNGENMMDIITHAFACNQTRVATLQWGQGATNRKFPSLGFSEGYHDLTHSNYNANRGKRAKISTWYVERFRYFIDKLNSIPEGNGTMLDNTALIFTSEHNGRSQHGRDSIPFFVAGRLGGAFNSGRYLNFSSNKRAHNDVYLSAIHGMGFTEVNSFGKSGLTRGTIPGLMA